MNSKEILDAIHSKKLIAKAGVLQPEVTKLSLMEKSKKLVDEVIGLPEVAMFKAIGLKNLLNDTKNVSQEQRNKFER